jgi:hypothetical protein
MAGELQFQYTTGKTLYAVILNPAGQAWYTVTPAFENITAAHWSSYAISLTEQAATGIYLGNFPTGITTFAEYGVLIYNQAGGSPAYAADSPSLSQGNMNWSGTAILYPVNTNTKGLVIVQYPIQKNVAPATPFQFVMTLAVDHISPYTGAANTITPYVNLDGVKTAISSGALASLAQVTGSPGDYSISLGAADVNGNFVQFRANATTCDTTKIDFATQV